MYNCLCGKEFINYQSFNGHKSHCKVNLESKGKPIWKSFPHKLKILYGKDIEKLEGSTQGV